MDEDFYIVADNDYEETNGRVIGRKRVALCAVFLEQAEAENLV